MPPLSGAAAEARIAQWVTALSTEQQPLADAALRLLVGLDPTCDARWSFNAPFVYAYGKIFAFLGHDRRGLLLGLAFGAQLDDPQGLLEATDRQLIRHYRLNALADLEREAFLELLGQQLDIAASAARRGESGWAGQVRQKRRR